MADKQTVTIYDQNITTYKKMVDKLPDIKPLNAFIDALQAGAYVLDWGSGPGYLAAEMRARGLRPLCVDASSKMVEAARNDYQLDAKQAEFSHLNENQIYDGIWANFSLLHVERAAFFSHISAAATALVPSGVFYVSVKLGKGQERDELGRFYSYFGQDELEEMLGQSGFEIIDIFTGKSKGLAGKLEKWIGILAKVRAHFTPK